MGSHETSQSSLRLLEKNGQIFRCCRSCDGSRALLITNSRANVQISTRYKLKLLLFTVVEIRVVISTILTIHIWSVADPFWCRRYPQDQLNFKEESKKTHESTQAHQNKKLNKKKMQNNCVEMIYRATLLAWVFGFQLKNYEPILSIRRLII